MEVVCVALSVAASSSSCDKKTLRSACPLLSARLACVYRRTVNPGGRSCRCKLLAPSLVELPWVVACQTTLEACWELNATNILFLDVYSHNTHNQNSNWSPVDCVGVCVHAWRTLKPGSLHGTLFSSCGRARLLDRVALQGVLISLQSPDTQAHQLRITETSGASQSSER